MHQKISPLLRSYDVVQNGHVEKLKILHLNTLFKQRTYSMLLMKHMFYMRQKAYGKRGRFIVQKYHSRIYIMVYLRLSVHCLKNSRDTRMSLIVKLTIFSQMNSQVQVNLIHMQSNADGENKWILVYQNKFMKYLQPQIVTSKHVPEIAYKLPDIFKIFGA